MTMLLMLVEISATMKNQAGRRRVWKANYLAREKVKI